MVDEVLAVGDAAFQKKCLGKISSVAKSGRTVLFVSHNMVAIESLCHRALLVERGQLRSVGNARELVRQYLMLDIDASDGRRDLTSHPGRTKRSVPVMRHVTLSSGRAAAISSLPMGAPLAIEVEFSSEVEPIRPVLGVVIRDHHGSSILGVNNRFIPGYYFNKTVANGTITCHFERLPLMPGKYLLDLYFGHEYDDLDIVHEAISFEICPADVFGTGQLPPSSVGAIFWPATWSLQNGIE
jgi:lipopolysaccharide transport system ATP-binding protein